MMYTLTHGSTVTLTHPDGSTASIPSDPSNHDYQEYLAWVADGNTAQPADPAPLVYNEDIRLQERGQTTTATPTEIYRAGLQQNTGYFGDLRVIGVDLGNGNVKEISAHVLVKRLGAGAVLVGSPVVVSSIQDAGASAWTITASVSGNDFVVTCSGAAGRTVAWSLTGQVTSFTPAGR
jgi:hypothetical protein